MLFVSIQFLINLKFVNTNACFLKRYKNFELDIMLYLFERTNKYHFTPDNVHVVCHPQHCNYHPHYIRTKWIECILDTTTSLLLYNSCYWLHVTYDGNERKNGVSYPLLIVKFLLSMVTCYSYNCPLLINLNKSKRVHAIKA